MTGSARLALLVALPPIGAGALWGLALLVSGLTGLHPVWTFNPRNLSEAAATGDGAAVVRLTRTGEDINGRWDVRPGVVHSTATALTPIEAAAATGERGMVQLLLDLGASPDAITWQRAYCVADPGDLRDLLLAHRPAAASDTCAGS